MTTSIIIAIIMFLLLIFFPPSFVSFSFSFFGVHERFKWVDRCVVEEL